MELLRFAQTAIMKLVDLILELLQNGLTLEILPKVLTVSRLSKDSSLLWQSDLMR